MKLSYEQKIFFDQYKKYLMKNQEEALRQKYGKHWINMVNNMATKWAVENASVQNQHDDDCPCCGA